MDAWLAALRKVDDDNDEGMDVAKWLDDAVDAGVAKQLATGQLPGTGDTLLHRLCGSRAVPSLVLCPSIARASAVRKAAARLVATRCSWLPDVHWHHSTHAKRAGTLASWLVLAGASPLVANNAGVTPLHVAAGSRHFAREDPAAHCALVHVLLDAAPDQQNACNVCDARGNSAMHWAASSGNGHLFMMLVQYWNGDWRLPNRKGAAPAIEIIGRLLQDHVSATLALASGSTFPEPPDDEASETQTTAVAMQET